MRAREFLVRVRIRAGVRGGVGGFEILGRNAREEGLNGRKIFDAEEQRRKEEPG